MRSITQFESRASHALRQAFDEVFDGARTGRWAIEQLEKTEKTYIGTKVEIIFRDEFNLGRGDFMDNKIADIEIDTKFSLAGQWMIPKEAVGHICLLVAGNDKTKKFKIGIVHADKALLNKGKNRDGKKTLSKAGRSTIRWIVKLGTLEPNFFAELSPAIRTKILAAKQGQARVTELFRQVQSKLIPRYVITLLGQQDDPMKRARDARKDLKAENIEVFGGRYQAAKMEEYGFKNVGPSDWLSIKSR